MYAPLFAALIDEGILPMSSSVLRTALCTGFLAVASFGAIGQRGDSAPAGGKNIDVKRLKDENYNQIIREDMEKNPEDYLWNTKELKSAGFNKVRVTLGRYVTPDGGVVASAMIVFIKNGKVALNSVGDSAAYEAKYVAEISDGNKDNDLSNDNRKYNQEYFACSWQTKRKTPDNQVFLDKTVAFHEDRIDINYRFESQAVQISRELSFQQAGAEDILRKTKSTITEDRISREIEEEKILYGEGAVDKMKSNIFMGFITGHAVVPAILSEEPGSRHLYLGF